MSTNTNTQSTNTQSLGRIARAAGVFYLIIIVAGLFAEGIGRAGIMVPGDVVATAENIINGERMFRISILADLAMVMSDVAIGVMFYYLLKPVNPMLSLLSGLFRLAQAAALGLNLLMLFLALQLLTGDVYLPVMGDSAQALSYLFLGAHGIGYKLALVFFAASILIQGYLFIRADYFPSWLGVAVIVASFGYTIDNVATFIMVDYEAYANVFEMIVIGTAVPVELGLALWLLVRGVGKGKSEPKPTMQAEVAANARYNYGKHGGVGTPAPPPSHTIIPKGA